jgi:hypothetical protein
MNSWLRLLFLALVPLLPLPAMAFCSEPQPRLVCAEYFARQLVVEATLIQINELHDKDDPEYVSAHVYTLRLNQAFRGKIAGTIRVYEGNDSGRAPFDWVAGREYLLFLFYAASEKSWELDGCGNSGPLSEAKLALSEIATIKAARGGGVIHGVVRDSEELPFTVIPGVRVEAQGATGRYSATTNEKGEFQMDVPAGKYTVHAVGNGLFFDRALFSYEDPSNIHIEPGGCAQVEFAKVARPPAR